MPKAIYRFREIPIKIPMITRASNPKICTEPQKTLDSKAILKKNKAGGITIPDFTLYYEAIVIKTICYQHKNSQINGAD